MKYSEKKVNHGINSFPFPVAEKKISKSIKLNNEFSKVTPSDRARILFKTSGLLAKFNRELSFFNSKDSLKPFKVSLQEVEEAYQSALYNAGWADKLNFVINFRGGNELRQFLGEDGKALGIVSVEIQDLFPVLSFIKNVFPALACGNSVVIIESKNNSSALILKRLLEESGLPVNTIMFSGESKVNSKIPFFKNSLKINQLSFLEDYPVNDAAFQCIKKIISPEYNTNQNINVFIQEGQKKLFVKKLENAFSKLIYGSPFGENTDIGNLSPKKEKDEFLKAIKTAKKENAGLIEPVKNQSAIFSDCNFSLESGFVNINSPLVKVFSYRTPAELVEKVNVNKENSFNRIFSFNYPAAIRIAEKFYSSTVRIGNI